MKYALVVLLLFSSAFAKKRDWKDAVVVAQGTSNGGVAALPVGTAIVALPLYFTEYKVETDDLIIVLATRKPINITLKKKTQIALNGKNAYLIDDDGKEKKLRIVLKEERKESVRDQKRDSH